MKLTVQQFKSKLKNKTNAKKYVSAVLDSLTKNVQFRNDEIELLLKQHPDTNKIKSIEYLILKKRPPFNNYALYVKNHDVEEYDISWKTCIEVLFGKYDFEKDHIQNVFHALRNAIFSSQRRQFFNCQLQESAITCNSDGTYFGKCCNCDRSDKIHIDHYKVPFKTIVENFVVTTGIDFKTLHVDETRNNCLEITDADIVEKWIQYHDAKVTYRVLCSHCNMSLGARTSF